MTATPALLGFGSAPRLTAGATAVSLLFASLLAGWLARPVEAHDGPTLAAVVEIADTGGFALYVVVDRRHLPAHVGWSAPALDVLGVPQDAGYRREARGIAAGLQVLFDGAPVPCRCEWVDPRTPTDVQLRLTGTVPAGARTVALRNALGIGTWVVSTRHAGRDDATATIVADGQAMEPVVFATDFVAPTVGVVARHFACEGFTHVVPRGLDHMLFVLGLFLAATRMRLLVLQVTAFTLAHTATLALAACGVFRLSSAVVEPLIAVSIVYIAVENVVSRRMGASRLAIVSAFGLLHGLGFAGALADLGLPPARKAVALASFNVGVEVGQLAVLGAAWLVIAVPFWRRPWYRARIIVPGSIMFAALGAYWAVTRLFAG